MAHDRRRQVEKHELALKTKLRNILIHDAGHARKSFPFLDISDKRAFRIPQQYVFEETAAPTRIEESAIDLKNLAHHGRVKVGEWQAGNDEVVAGLAVDCLNRHVVHRNRRLDVAE